MRTKTPNLPDRMLEAAAMLFGMHRFHEVRMEDIAAESGVGKGTLYRYFKDKEELYVALLERASRHLNERLADRVVPGSGSVEQLVALVDTIVTFFDEQPHLLAVIQRAEVMRGPDFPWQQTREVVIQMVADLFKTARRRKEFSVEDPDLAALMLLGGLRSVIRLGQQPRSEDLARRIVNGFLGGVAMTSAKRPRIENPLSA